MWKAIKKIAAGEKVEETSKHKRNKQQGSLQIQSVARQRQRESSPSFQNHHHYQQDHPQPRHLHHHDVGCMHGCVELPSGGTIDRFVRTFLHEFNSTSLVGNVKECFKAARAVTQNKYPNVYSDPSKMDLVVSYFLWNGTQMILKGLTSAAGILASISSYFEQTIDVKLHKTRTAINWKRLLDLFVSDEDTVFSYFRNRIPCICLDEIDCRLATPMTHVRE